MLTALLLTALPDDVPALTKTKITYASMLSGAWKILEIDYGNVQEIRAKLKDEVRSIKFKATGDSAKLVKLYYSLQVISANIKASGSLSLLDNDKEYVILVLKHLQKDIAWRCCE